MLTPVEGGPDLPLAPLPLYALLKLVAFSDRIVLDLDGYGLRLLPQGKGQLDVAYPRVVAISGVVRKSIIDSEHSACVKRLSRKVPAPGDGEGESSGSTPIDRFYGVNVTVWAELGRATMSLGDLLQVGEGSVLKLDRPVSAPVDLMAQGIRVARGEVVVVDDHFAIRIKEIERTRDLKP